MAWDAPDKVSGSFSADLDAFAARLKSNVARVGAQAMAEEVYIEAKLGVPVLDGGHTFYGTHAKYFFPAGTLRDAIYQVFSKDKSSVDRAEYHVAWNHQKAPYGFMVEFGTVRAPAHPFLYPAYERAKQSLPAIANAAMAAALKVAA
jgi:HK97 gp10 family phage protein